MTALLDTSIVVRYLTGDGAQAPLSQAIVESDEDLALHPVVLAEVAYVLTTNYRLLRETAVDRLIELVRRENVRVLEIGAATAVEALELCRPSSRVSFADAMIWATARSSGLAVYTFDERFPDQDIEVRRGPA